MAAESYEVPRQIARHGSEGGVFFTRLCPNLLLHPGFRSLRKSACHIGTSRAYRLFRNS